MDPRTPQERARDKWNDNNREKSKVYIAKSTCKRYIRDFAELEDLEKVKKWVKEKEKKLKNI